jgi:hypothetical protein
MSLPIINETTSFMQKELLSGKKIGLKQWRTKEERELLFATEGIQDTEDGKREIIKFIKKCVDDPNKFDTLSNTDYINCLIELRKISKGSLIEYKLKCSKDKFELFDSINLTTDVKSKKFDSNPIQLSQDLSFSIKEVPYVVYDALLKKYEKSSEFNFYYTINSIDSIAYKGEVFDKFTEEELIDFVDALPSLENEEGKSFLDILTDGVDKAQAEIYLEKTLTCGKCKTENPVRFGDLYHFLAF